MSSKKLSLRPEKVNPIFAPRHGAPPGDRGGANQRFKRSFGRRVSVGVLVAVALHLVLIEIFPRMRIEDVRSSRGTVALLELPPEVAIPPAPERIARPATPRVAAVEVDERLTIAPTTFEANPAELLRPPPLTEVTEGDRPSYIPFTTAPVLQNTEEVVLLLERLYPPTLKAAGIAGTVLLWIYIDEVGQVLDTRVKESSGFDVLDLVAQMVAGTMRFSPAKNGDRVTPVWLAQPINFVTTG